MELVHKQIKQRNGESSRKNGMSWREVDPEVVLTWVRVCQDARQIASGLPIMFSPLAQYHAMEAVECRKGHEALSENKAKIQWLILVNHHFPYEKWKLFWIYSIFCHWTWKNLDHLAPQNTACHGSWTVRSQSQSRVGSLRRRGVGEGNLRWVKHKPTIC